MKTPSIKYFIDKLLILNPKIDVYSDIVFIDERLYLIKIYKKTPKIRFDRIF